MSNMKRQYRYSAQTVDAIQFTGENMAEVTTFLKPEGGPWNPQGANAQCPLKVWTAAAGPTPVLIGQFIVRDKVRGLYIVNADVFADLVEEPAAEKVEKPTAHRKPISE